ncbi:MAG: lipid-binding SYLF domain-containing protein [Gammaproteobacteria bacterium]|nr:lipid-binding SYLF domain-containing protein [Gammaproteobacteria bacterium]
MRRIIAGACIVALSVGLSIPAAHADAYQTTIERFKSSELVQPYFKNAYAFAVFPVVGKAGFVVGGAYGDGKVYRGGQVVGTTTLTHVSVGFQLGGQAFSEIIFFQDKRAYEEFTRGEFEFDAKASAVVVTLGAQAQAGTAGASAGASIGPATGKQLAASYNKGMAVFVHIKGGLMYEAAIGGQKFTFKPVSG